MTNGAVTALIAVALWVNVSPGAAVVFLVLKSALYQVRVRPRFVDVGRFSIGGWRPVRDEGHILALGLTRYGETGSWNGVRLTVGRSVFAVFAILPRREWPEYRRTVLVRRRRKTKSSR
ncbi:hypothetical protein LUR56_39835 [Streptomyces sp. MT29]|nr:hypothetical protein [Streptomyces sp. MT29]